jgi:hypothetical protein
LEEFVSEQFSPFMQKLEAELDAQRSKKIKGTTSKKQKEKKEMELNYKLTQAKKLMEKIEELKTSMEFIEGGTIKDLKEYLRCYLEAPDNDTNKHQVESELKRILEITESQRKVKQMNE